MAKVVKLCAIEVADEVGKLAELTDSLKAEGINILAVCGWAKEGRGHMLVATDSQEKACELLGSAAGSCTWQDALCIQVPNTPGGLNEAAQKLAGAGVNINMFFATPGDADQANIVMCTSDDAKASELV